MKQQKSIARQRRLVIKLSGKCKNLKSHSQAKTVQNVHWKLRQNGGEETASNASCATIDCVSTMALNEVKWVKQIIIQGLMCVTVKFDTIT